MSLRIPLQLASTAIKPITRWLLIAGLYGILSAQAQTSPKVEQFTLANGMTVIVKPDRRAPTAVHMVWLRVGSMDEVDGTSGVAHLL